jgi:hypothetical protein
MPKRSPEPAGAPTVSVPPPPEGGGLIDASADLVQAVIAYLRQEAGDLVREKIVQPTQKAGAVVALGIGVAVVLSVGILFVSAGALILLATWIGWPAALFAVGGVLILGSAGIAYFRSRSMQP